MKATYFLIISVSLFSFKEALCQNKQLPKKNTVKAIPTTPKTKNIEPTVEETKLWIIEKLNKYCRDKSYITRYKEGGYIESFINETNFRFENNNLVFDYYETSEKTLDNNRTCKYQFTCKGQIIINSKYFSTISETTQGYIKNFDTYEAFPQIIVQTEGNNITFNTIKQYVSYQCEKSMDDTKSYAKGVGIQVDFNAEPNLRERLSKAFNNLKNAQKTKEAY